MINKDKGAGKFEVLCNQWNREPQKERDVSRIVLFFGKKHRPFELVDVVLNGSHTVTCFPRYLRIFFALCPKLDDRQPMREGASDILDGRPQGHEDILVSKEG